MKQTHVDFERRGVPVLWMLATSVGWALVPFTPLQTVFRTYAEIARQVPVYALVGLLLGATTGLGQSLVWRLQGQPAARWWWASVLGYGLALPLGLIVFTCLLAVLPMLLGRDPLLLPLTEPGSLVYFPLPAALALCGGVVGTAQWSALRRLLAQTRLSVALLWIFGVWLSLSLGMALGGLVRDIAPGLGWTVVQGVVGRAAAGAAIGMLTGVLLIMLLREAGRLSARAWTG